MLTIITEIIASEGSLSQLIRPVMRPRRNSVQLITLNVGSNIHFHAKVDNTVGMMNGSRTKARVSALPLKWRLSRSATQRPNTNLKTRGTPLLHNVVSTPTPKNLYFPHPFKVFTPPHNPGT